VVCQVRLGWRHRVPGRAGPGWEDPISPSIALVAVVLLVLANGFFVATEFALVAVRRTRVQQLASEGSARARSVLGLLDHLDTYIAATQLGITISSIGLGWIGEPAVARLIEPALEQAPFLPESWRESATHTIAFIIAFSIITALHIVFGELAPKSLALQRSEETSLWVATPIRTFELVFRPVIFLLNGVGNAVVRLFGIQPASGHELVQSAEELKLAIDASREAGLVEAAAHDLVDRAFLFTDLDVRHAMVPRTEVTAVSVDATLMDILRLAAETSHTRLPVYEQDNDHIVGVVNIKRLLPLLYEGAESSARFDVRDYLSEVFAVPETVPAADVLARMREARVQLAVVVDEYGGTAGIVTLEDLVESLVGEIEDEGDGEQPEVPSDGRLVLDGLTTLVEAREYFDLDLNGTLDVETVGGWVFGVLGRPAVVGDEVATPDGRVLRVEELDGLRVARVRLLPPNDGRPPDGAERGQRSEGAGEGEEAVAVGGETVTAQSTAG
jgi:CBS domain containing-hemolysin-like protein